MDDPGTVNVAGIRTFELDEPIFAAHQVGDSFAFVLGEKIVLVGPDGTPQHVEPHAGAILASCGRGSSLLSGGDDGRIVLTDAAGATRTLAVDAKRRWIDHVASGADGSVAWSAGRQVFVLTPDGNQTAIDLPGAVGGLALLRDSLGVIVAHNNGLTFWCNERGVSGIQTWEGAGSNAHPVVSPDGRLVATALHEPGMRIWRLADGAMMPLSGYSGRVRSYAWTPDGAYLVTSGAERIILWPAPEKAGRLYSVPVLVAPNRAPSVAAAAHPREPLIAAGYSNGLVLLVRLTDAAEIVMKRPDGARISALTWSTDGALVIASESGKARILQLAKAAHR
jgi:hypothetical protein